MKTKSAMLSLTYHLPTIYYGCYIFFFIPQFMLTCKPTCDAKLCSLTVETNTPPLSKQEIWMPNGSTDLSMCTRRNSPGDGL